MNASANQTRGYPANLTLNTALGAQVTSAPTRFRAQIPENWITGWWFDWNMVFVFPYIYIYILGMSSSQLTLIFFRGVGQPPSR